IPIEDIDRNSVWVSHIGSMCPPFDVVYSNNPLVTRLFEEEGIEVRGMSLFKRDRYSGTRIRELILKGEEWEHLVPDPVSGAIDEINGVERLRKVSESDH
ncbi:MAG: nicotinamide-nucleotide adenylyltransferase, partial [Halobacteria archaeon]|nr:nicotinamide-nucleotide adenylyltransferase [Halobacteria archaeon]